MVAITTMITIDLHRKIIKKSKGTDLRQAYTDAKILWYKSSLLMRYRFPFWVTETVHDDCKVDNDGTAHLTTKREFQIYAVDDWVVQ
jgi:hypothetical protein